MTTAVDLTRAFRDALPHHARPNLTPELQTLLLVAASHGWTVQQLTAECLRNRGHVVNGAGLTMHRLRGIEGPPPPQPRQPAPLCGHCDHGWRYDETTDPVTVTRCECRKAV